jgi:signal transduction histidine kinase
MSAKQATDAPHFRVSPSVLGPLGAEQLQDPALAVLELIKNSWDADARRVSVSIETRTNERAIVVRDDGHGMTEAEFRNYWLVIGASYKRSRRTTEAGSRPLIGEKGLGRLATFALGRVVTIESAREPQAGFAAEINWATLQASSSLEEYPITISSRHSERGTRVEIRDLVKDWIPTHTDFLISHAEFLTSVPGEEFNLSISIDSKPQIFAEPSGQIRQWTEGQLEIAVDSRGVPHVTTCIVEDEDYSDVPFRQFPKQHFDSHLAGMRLRLNFFRRDQAQKASALARNATTALLERYQGIRIYRDGINVPPYGLNGDDWAGLEKQRTRFGGPTMVPGNSQLVGELHLSRDSHPHLIVTAGRAGFADQQAVASLARYTQWAVRELGTARRAAELHLHNRPVPSRLDNRNEVATPRPDTIVQAAFEDVAKNPSVRRDPKLRLLVDQAKKQLLLTLVEKEDLLRLYAQLASTGIAATSFAHELRAEFDAMSEAISELKVTKHRPDPELLNVLDYAWGRVRSFAALFQVVPVKLRRKPRLMTAQDLADAARATLALAIPDKVTSELVPPHGSVRIIPAELDSILVNLVSNAVKAINESPNREKGRILISLATRGPNLEIRVADNGCGVSDKVKNVMFEPLEGAFSEGTGMGLPIVAFLASRYDGIVTLAEHAPEGYRTEFFVLLKDLTDDS